MYLEQLLSIDDLEEELAGGWVTCREHPELPLSIFNYTNKTMYANRWNPVTRACRGLIVDDSNYVVSRPWEKFFNWGQGQVDVARFLHRDLEVTDKMDGSLGILYSWGGQSYIATRGSFTSKQARHATEVLHQRYPDLKPPLSYTFLFEIIYPENRIVLDYGSTDDLVLLGAVNKETGGYLGVADAKTLLGWGGPTTPVLSVRTLTECLQLHREGKEGVVLRSGDHLVKVKQDDYMALHKVIYGVSRKTIWESLSKGSSTQEIVEVLPDELHAWATGVCEELTQQYLQVRRDVFSAFMEIMSQLEMGYTRKDFAVKANKAGHPSILYALLDEKDITPLLWNEVLKGMKEEA